MTLEIYEKGLGHHMYEKMAWESPLKKIFQHLGKEYVLEYSQTTYLSTWSTHMGKF